MVTMNKRNKRMSKIKITGYGKECPKCSKPMQRRKHLTRPLKSHFYTEWDYCEKCKHVQHYEEYKSSDWSELDRMQNFIKNI